MNAKTTEAVTFEKADTNEWYVEIDSGWVATLVREKPTRWAVGARRGLAVDRAKPWMWTVVGARNAPVNIDGMSIPDGTSLRDAKKLVASAILSAI